MVSSTSVPHPSRLLNPTIQKITNSMLLTQTDATNHNAHLFGLLLLITLFVLLQQSQMELFTLSHTMLVFMLLMHKVVQIPHAHRLAICVWPAALPLALQRQVL